jgi:sterol desaturase/sphingolipid hydroxylase (fatty acid hydroxylase superfamily)
MLPDWLSLHSLLPALIKLGWGICSFLDASQLISYLNFFGALAIATLLYGWARRSGITQSWRDFVFPSTIWKHHSARLDIKYYLVIQAIFVVLLIPVLGLVDWASAGISLGLDWLLGPSPLALGPWTGGILYTLAMFIALDLGFFYSHYLSHKYPLLWCFHKVHHSAEVLVPFTSLRFHPLDLLWNAMFSAALASILGGICRYGFYRDGSEISLFGNNMIVALSYLTTHNLRHMHIWLHYPQWLNRFFISPAQHQIHHSRERRHWDKNMGYLLTCWDRWFGTLYTPEQREEFAFGVDGMPQEGLRAHRSIQSLLIGPFLDAADWWRGLQSQQEAAQDKKA